MNAHLHLGLLEGEVNAGDLGLHNLLFHLVIGKHTVKRVTLDQLSFLGRFSVRFQNVDRLDWISLNSLKVVIYLILNNGYHLGIRVFDHCSGVNHHFSKEVGVHVDDLRAHRRL